MTPEPYSTTSRRMAALRLLMRVADTWPCRHGYVGEPHATLLELIADLEELRCAGVLVRYRQERRRQLLNAAKRAVRGRRGHPIHGEGVIEGTK